MLFIECLRQMLFAPGGSNGSAGSASMSFSPARRRKKIFKCTMLTRSEDADKPCSFCQARKSGKSSVPTSSQLRDPFLFQPIEQVHPASGARRADKLSRAHAQWRCRAGTGQSPKSRALLPAIEPQGNLFATQRRTIHGEPPSCSSRQSSSPSAMDDRHRLNPHHDPDPAC